MTVTDALVAWVLAFGISLVTVPVGVSGAVFLLPVQLGVLHAPNPAVTPTNLLYNVVALPGALWRFRRRGLLRGRLVRLMLLGTVPGVIVGAVLRVTVLDGPQVFRLLLAGLLLALGSWLVVGTLRPPGAGVADERRRSSLLTPAGIVVLSLGVGVVGGVYGIGGGSILGPVLVGLGLAVQRVAPAALLTTFVTSVVGLAAFATMAALGAAAAAPDWSNGLLLGSAGLVGGWVGVRIQSALPERTLRLLLGIVALALALGYLLTSWLA